MPEDRVIGKPPRRANDQTVSYSSTHALAAFFFPSMPAPHLQFRIAEIDARRDTPGTLIECLRFDNDGRQNKYGSILAFAEIQSSVYLYERLLDTVHAAITQARTMVTGLDSDPMIRFEKIVQKVNEALSAFATAEAAPIQWHKVNLFVFQLAEEHLCFSGLGSLTNIFLQQQPTGEVKAFDLLGSLEQPTDIDAQKPLASIVCGTMGIGDMLFVGTQSVQAVREKIHLVELCKDHPPVAAAFEIQQSLQALKSLEAYYGVLMAGVALTPAKTERSAVAAAVSESIEKTPEPATLIHEFEQETEEILEQGSVHAGPGFSGFFTDLKQKASNFMDSLSSKQSSPEPARESLSAISLAGLRSMNSGYARGLFSEKRRLIIAGAVVVVVLLVGGFWLSSARKSQAEQKLWMAVYDRSVEAKNRAEAALVYGDEERARAQYAQALTSFEQLDQKTADRTKARTDLEKGLSTVRTRLRKEQVLTAPIVVADLHENGQAVDAQGLVMQGTMLYTIDRTGNRARIINTKDGALSSAPAPEGISLRLVGNGQNSPLLVGNERSVFTIRNGAITPLSMSAVSKASSTNAITSYGQRVYALDPTNGMIWRYSANANGLSGESAYLKTASDDVRGAVSLAIDSSIYVASNNRVTKFTSGERDSWGLMPIDPPVKQLSSIWTSTDSASIVVADPQNKRVIIFAKDGKLISQLLSPAFQGPTSVWGDSVNNILYILDGGKIYKTDLPR